MRNLISVPKEHPKGDQLIFEKLIKHSSSSF